MIYAIIYFTLKKYAIFERNKICFMKNNIKKTIISEAGLCKTFAFYRRCGSLRPDLLTNTLLSTFEGFIPDKQGLMLEDHDYIRCVVFLFYLSLSL